MKRISKILITNRGEIAVRIIRAAQNMSINTLSVYAEDDKESLHVKCADESISLGNGLLSNTYLNIQNLINIAVQNKCDAIHPGYGFLSENEHFALVCEENNITFIGPSADSLHLMGNKQEARKTVRNLGFPIIEGFDINVNTISDQLPYPLILKPTLGGGGKGMYIVNSADELVLKYESASREANNFFANGSIYAEHYITKARHIEVQIIADNHGNVVHLFDRECTIQRNFQKIIEEAPSPSLQDDLRKELTAAAVTISKSINYSNAGTVEFLLDEKNNWYFIEMNTRIQVEHPVTEAITGIDIVSEQIQIAEGNPISFSQNDIKINGHAIELRINSEDPENNFRPSAGKIVHFNKPNDCRVDTFFEAPFIISPSYDSLLAKYIIWGKSRNETLRKTTQIISEASILGIPNNIEFLEMLVKSNEFINNIIYTRFCNDFIPKFISQRNIVLIENSDEVAAAIFTYLYFQKPISYPKNIWEQLGTWSTSIFYKIIVNQIGFQVRVKVNRDKYEYQINNKTILLSFDCFEPNKIKVFIAKSLLIVHYKEEADSKLFLELNRVSYVIESPNILETAVKSASKTVKNELSGAQFIKSPIHGRVVKIAVSEQQKVKKGNTLMILEAMKTENHIIAPSAGIVKSIFVKEGLQVKDNEPLIELV